MNSVLESIFADGIVNAEDGTPRSIHSQISRQEGEFIQEVIRQSRPKRSIEIGCAYGVSSVFICEALAAVRAEKHTIVDPYQMGRDHDGPDQGYEGIGIANVRRAGFADLIEFVGEQSCLCLPRFLAENRRYDFAFIDGMHTFDYALVDFFYIDRMLNVGGVIIFDDLNYPSIRKLCRYILRNLSYRNIGPFPNSSPTLKRKIATRIASMPRLGRYMKSEVIDSDSALGIPDTNYLALTKVAHDVIADHGKGTRRWDTHRSF